MEPAKAAFVALALPVFVVAALVTVLFTRDVLLAAARKKELSMRHHGLPAAIVLSFLNDAVQVAYYGIGRLFPDLWPKMYYAWATLSIMRLLVLVAGVVALATYARLAGWRAGFWHIVLAAALAWAVCFALLVKW